MPQLADIFMARSKLPNQWHSNFLAQYHMPEQPHVLVDAPGGVLMRQKKWQVFLNASLGLDKQLMNDRSSSIGAIAEQVDAGREACSLMTLGTLLF
jgi:hypothetical protein